MDEVRKIDILWDVPIIFTRNKEFADYVDKNGPFKPGDVVFLPEDAVLAKLPLPPEASLKASLPAPVTPIKHITDDETVIQ